VINEHVAAFAALITDAGRTLYDAESPDEAAPPYVVMYADTGNREAAQLCDDQPYRVWTIQTTCVGTTREQAAAEAQLVEDAVEGVRPVVVGRSCTRIKRIVSRPATRDDDVQPAVFYQIDQWRWTSAPA
jgi:hypothetical protein